MLSKSSIKVLKVEISVNVSACIVNTHNLVDFIEKELW
jgi:hypothetical protein